MSFRFVDLFAGIGGFHAALGALGGNCVYASEWDEDAAKVYERNWGIRPEGDITLVANEDVMEVPEHDVLVGGFPCQPFSKSGKQQGMEETRGTLFWNIAKIIEVRKPSIVLLENVQNIAGPRHIHEWQVIIKTLRDLGYRVSDNPMVVSPHEIRPEFGGRPQVRNRIFISATKEEKVKKDKYLNVPIPDLSYSTIDWDPQNWNLEAHLPLQELSSIDVDKVALAENELQWIECWNDFVVSMRKDAKVEKLPGFPIWVDHWVDLSELHIPEGTPKWKSNFFIKNSTFYTENRKFLDAWLTRWNKLQDFPPSRRKFEWQAQDAESLWDTIMHFRPSGIRAKKATYVPALVAITQTTIIGKRRRRISFREGARLQGLPDWFDFGTQSESATFKQLGNGVNVGAVYNVLRAQVLRDIDLLGEDSDLVKAVLGAPPSPDVNLGNHDFYENFSASSEPVDLTKFQIKDSQSVQLKLLD